MLRMPIPFALAVVVATVAVTVYLYLTVISVPAVGDGNFTSTLVAGSHYLWRGSAGLIEFESNSTIELTYTSLPYVVHLNCMPGNVTINSNTMIFKLATRSYPILYIYDPYLGPVLFKLVNITKIGDISVFVPQTFALTETLTSTERSALTARTGYGVHYRVVDVYTNGTHLILFMAYDTSSTPTLHGYIRFPSATMGTFIRTSFTGIGFSYMLDGTPCSGYAMPYTYFLIKPQANTRVVIYLR
ncbi:MAG: hypothetical protein ACO2PN_14625 [Pyrobaculum sp.]|jgi:hypothetical protein